jgi:hypothetical protein
MPHMPKSLPRSKAALMSIPRKLARAMAICLCGALLGACSMGQMVARSSLPILESSNVAMNRETDLDLARAAIPANLKLVEGLIQELPDCTAGDGNTRGRRSPPRDFRVTSPQ